MNLAFMMVYIDEATSNQKLLASSPGVRIGRLKVKVTVLLGRDRVDLSDHTLRFKEEYAEADAGVL